MFSILKTEVMLSSETSVHMWTTLRDIPENNIHNYRCDNLISYCKRVNVKSVKWVTEMSIKLCQIISRTD
jgi:hypothetical protein